jgi:hypothetical protein
MKNFLRRYLNTFSRPSEAFASLLDDKHYFRNGFLYMLIPVTGYTLMYIFLVIGNGAPSVFTPWLNIPKEVYYSVNVYLLAPSMILSWFTAAAVIQVLSHLAGGKGTFEQSLATTGLSISVAMWATLLHDLVMSFLSATRVIDAREHEIAMNSPTIWRTILWLCFIIYFFAFISLFGRTVRVVHKVSPTAGFFIGTTAFVLFQLIFVVFNR